MKWSESTTYSFVSEYLKYECLYNTKSRDSKNKQARESAINEICVLINIPGFGPKEAFAKIKSIRSTFSQEAKKVLDSTKSGASGDVYVPSLKWFRMYNDVMKEKNLEPRKTEDNLVTVNNDWHNESATASVLQAATSSESYLQEETEQKKLPRKRSNIAQLDCLVKKVKAVGEMVQDCRRNENENEFDIFGKSISAQLKQIPFIMALQAQTHIQSYLSDLRIKTYTHPNILDYTPSPLSTTTYISPPLPSTPPMILPEDVHTERAETEVNDETFLEEYGGEQFRQLKYDDDENENDILQEAVKSIIF